MTGEFDYNVSGTFPGTTGTCLVPLAPLATCEVVMTYSPGNVAIHTDNLTVNYNDGVDPQSVVRGLTGQGVAPASLDISETDAFTFGDVADGSLNDHTFVISNTGSQSASALGEAVALTPPFIFKGANTFPGNGGTCGATLATSSNCSIVVSYNPVAVGPNNDTIELSYFDGVNTIFLNRNIAGNAVAPGQIDISLPDPYDYMDAVSYTHLTLPTKA